EVWMKLNCEGSECDILDSLLATSALNTIKNVLVDFDALKIPSQKHRVSAMQQRLIDQNVPYSLPEDVQYGNVTNYGGIRNWLLVSGARAQGITAVLHSWMYNLKVVIKRPEVSGYHKMKALKMFPFLSRFARSRRKRSAGFERRDSFTA